jgi:hypothetical protein
MRIRSQKRNALPSPSRQARTLIAAARSRISLTPPMLCIAGIAILHLV